MIFRALLFFLLLCGISSAKSHREYAPIIAQALSSTSGPAKRVLYTAHRMVKDKVIIRGSCWNYLNAAYTKAGFGKDQRKIVYKQSKNGPYAPVSYIKPGDWLYYINHSYGGVEHSGMFIGWVNRRKKQGLILSYPGERRKKPGRYRVYDLRSVYQIVRVISPKKKHI